MVSLTRYFLWFFLFCLLFTCICGVVAALLPMGIGAVFTVIPYLIAMIWVLFKFLKQQQRAPTQAERLKMTIGFSCIYWLYNISFLVMGIFIATESNPEALKNFLLYIQNVQFLMIVGTMFLIIAVPLFLITYWFYGKQAERMVLKMFTK